MSLGNEAYYSLVDFVHDDRERSRAEVETLRNELQECRRECEELRGAVAEILKSIYRRQQELRQSLDALQAESLGTAIRGKA